MVLTATSGRESEEEVLQQWLERANGGQGCWTEDGMTKPIQDDRGSNVDDGHFATI
jgi:hypothetical protein